MQNFNLQLFADGSEGGSDTQGKKAGNNASTGGYSFEQAEEIANARAERAQKSALRSYFTQQGLSEEQIGQAIADFKARQAAATPDLDAITRERDAARAELEQYKHRAVITEKGIPTEFADFALFSVREAMQKDSKLDFEHALAKFIKENPRFSTAGSTYRVHTGAEGASKSDSPNAIFNEAFRRATGRT